MLRIARLVVIAVLIAGCGSAPAGAPAKQPQGPTLSPAGTSATTDLTEATRKQIYWDLVTAQDKGVGDEESYTVVAKKHGVTVEMVKKIAVEGSTKLWPIPTAPN